MKQQNNEQQPSATIQISKQNVLNQFDGFLKKIMKKAGEERMLPKLVWNVSKEYKSQKMKDYQKCIRKEYIDHLRTPLQYNPEESKSAREKFQQKIHKLINNDLDIEYFDKVRVKDKNVIKFHGHDLEEKKIQTKKEFAIFNNFNEKTFKQTYANVFEDKLEVKFNQIYPIKEKGKAKKCYTVSFVPSDQIIQNKVHSNAPRQYHMHTQTSLIKIKPKAPQKKNLSNFTDRQSTEPTSRKKSPMTYYRQVDLIGKEIFNLRQAEQVLRIMQQIGKYPQKTPKDKMNLTNESIFKYLKGLYDKPHRLIDFLEFDEVVNFQEFAQISKRLKLMPINHIHFMAFLFYDSNCDGYIDDGDLQKIKVLGEKRHILMNDYKKIKKHGFKKKIEQKVKYLELYKLNEITETSYFEWKQEKQYKTPSKVHFDSEEIEIKNFIVNFKNKHIFIDFEAFSQIYKQEKPFIWYDLLQKLSGSKFEGLKYD